MECWVETLEVPSLENENINNNGPKHKGFSALVLQNGLFFSGTNLCDTSK